MRESPGNPSNVIAFPETENVAMAMRAVELRRKSLAEIDPADPVADIASRMIKDMIERGEKYLRQERARLGFRLHGNAKLEKRDQANLVVLSQYRARSDEAA